MKSLIIFSVMIYGCSGAAPVQQQSEQKQDVKSEQNESNKIPETKRPIQTTDTSSVTTPSVETKQQPKKLLGVALTKGELDQCNQELNGATTYVISDQLFRYCDGQDWQVLNLKGKDGVGLPGRDGVDGKSIVGATGATGSTGPQGERGLDGQSIKGDRGLPGESIVGPQGVSGQSITGPIGPTGNTGATGQSIQGPPGAAGKDAYNLATSSRNATNIECPNGGKATDIWLDKNDNGQYDQDTDSQFKSIYACNGTGFNVTYTQFNHTNDTEFHCVKLATSSEGLDIYAVADSGTNVRLNYVDTALRTANGETFASLCTTSAYTWVKHRVTLASGSDNPTLTQIDPNVNFKYKVIGINVTFDVYVRN